MKQTALVVVGGHSRNVGKTSVVAGLIAALPEYRWTAMKITQDEHWRNSETLDGVPPRHSWFISEETSRAGDTDTSRFVAAGAERAWWVRSEPGRLAEAVPAIRRKLAESRYAILESNSIIGFLKPDLYLTVLDPAKQDFKQSARDYFDHADAILLHACRSAPVNSLFHEMLLNHVAERPVFNICPPQYVTPEVSAFVRSRLRPPH